MRFLDLANAGVSVVRDQLDGFGRIDHMGRIGSCGYVNSRRLDLAQLFLNRDYTQNLAAPIGLPKPTSKMAEASGSRTHHRRRKTTITGFEDRNDHRTACASNLFINKLAVSCHRRA